MEIGVVSGHQHLSGWTVHSCLKPGSAVTRTLPHCQAIKKFREWSKIGVANYVPWAKSGVPPGLVNKALLEHGHTYSFTYYLWLLS